MLPPMLPPVGTMRPPASLPSLKLLQGTPGLPPAPLRSAFSAHTSAAAAMFSLASHQRTDMAQHCVKSEQLHISRPTFPTPVDHHLYAPPAASVVPHRVTTTTRLSEEDEDEDDGLSSHSRSPTAVGGNATDKRARRKEQCRVNQANYRKRKRQHELQLAGYIKTLEREIEELTTRKHTLAEQSHAEGDDDARGPEHAIASFYYAMQAPVPSPRHRRLDTSRAQFASLRVLQCEEFASIEQLLDQWEHHKRHFRCFQLHVLSSERLEVGELAIIKMEAELEIAVDLDQTREAREAWWRTPFVCAVQQRFEIDPASGSVTRITSEADLVAGVAAATQRTPQSVSQLLEELLELQTSRNY